MQASHAAWAALAKQCTLQHQAEQQPCYEAPQDAQVTLHVLPHNQPGQPPHCSVPSGAQRVVCSLIGLSGDIVPMKLFRS